MLTGQLIAGGTPIMATEVVLWSTTQRAVFGLYSCQLSAGSVTYRRAALTEYGGRVPH